MTVADLDPSRPGLEAVAVGRAGVAMFGAGDCRRVWRIPATVIRDPRHVAAARLDPGSPSPLLAVGEDGPAGSPPRTFLVDGRGRIVRSREGAFLPMQNADLDGARGADELVGAFGGVIDRFGRPRLGRAWYWNLRGRRRVIESPLLTPYDRWQAFPLVFDYDGDGRDEIVQWGRGLIVVGKAR